MEIHYYRKSVYGHELIYLVYQGKATVAIHWLTGKKTISETDLQCLTNLGLVMVEVIAPQGGTE